MRKSRRFTGESPSTSSETPKTLGKGLRRKKSTSFYKSKVSSDQSSDSECNDPTMPEVPVFKAINDSSGIYY